MEYLNHNPNWLKTITIEIDKLLINCEYINFFMIMYMQWSKDDSSNSSSQTLIIACMHRFGKLALSKSQLYIDTQTIIQCFVCHNCKNTILIWSAEGKEKVFYILQMLRIHNGLRKFSETNIYDLHLWKKYPLDIGVPCIKIARSEVFFEQYRMALNCEKYNTEARNDDVINHTGIFFDFMQQTFNSLDG